MNMQSTPSRTIPLPDGRLSLTDEDSDYIRQYARSRALQDGRVTISQLCREMDQERQEALWRRERRMRLINRLEWAGVAVALAITAAVMLW